MVVVYTPGHAAAPERAAEDALSSTLLRIAEGDDSYPDYPAAFDLKELDGSSGHKINGVSSNDYSGSSVSGAGDVNGDGIADLIVGASRAGQSYVVFGTEDGYPKTLDLGALDGSNGFALSGNNSGSSVSGAGDINGDGFDDVIVGGVQSHVVFGAASGFPARLDLDNLDGGNGFAVIGGGRSVSEAGDVNGDGLDDFIIGDPGAGRAGRAYVVFGASDSFPPAIALLNLDGSNGFTLEGVSRYGDTGASVSGAGDVDGDGFDDLIIGAPGAGLS